MILGDEAELHTESSGLSLALAVSEADADDERLDHLTGRMIRDLRDLGVESIEREAGGTAPEGAKGDPFTLGVLALAIVPALLPKLVDFLQAWTLRRRARTIKLEMPGGVVLEITPEKRLTDEELVALVEKLGYAQG